MNLKKIVTGQVARENKIDRLSCTAALARLGNASKERFHSDFGTALAFTVRSFTRQLLIDSPIPQYRQIGKKIDERTVERLAAYIAWFITVQLVSRITKSTQEDDDNFEDMDEVLADMELIRGKIYPDNDPHVQKAIKRAVKNNAAVVNGEADADKWTKEMVASLDYVLGVSSDGSDREGDARRSFVVVTQLGDVGNIFEEFYAKLAALDVPVLTIG